MNRFALRLVDYHDVAVLENYLFRAKVELFIRKVTSTALFSVVEKFVGYVKGECVTVAEPSVV